MKIKTDKEILNLISDVIVNERETISLIPSENVMSDLATKMYCGRSNNRYVIPIKIGNKFFMPGRENLGDAFSLLEKRLCSIYKTKYAIVESLSGLHQMGVIMSAMRKMADFAITLDKFHGGHSKTRGIALKYGFRVSQLKLDPDTWDIDYKILNKTIKKLKDKKVLIYIDHTINVNPLNMGKLLKAVPSKWIVYYDISHLQLFYFSHIFSFPKYKNFFFGGTTHKTFPGPQKAIILLDNKRFYASIKKDLKKTLSSVHTGSILALLITVIEMEKFGLKYANDIITKTRYFAKLLSSKLHVVGPLPYLTNTHQICIDVPDIVKITKKLASIGIITMPERVPFTRKKGLRLGIQELCRLGLKNKDIDILSEIIIACVKGNKTNIQLKSRVKKIARRLNNIRYILRHKNNF